MEGERDSDVGRAGMEAVQWVRHDTQGAERPVWGE